jgi:hypothetical protein
VPGGRPPHHPFKLAERNKANTYAYLHLQVRHQERTQSVCRRRVRKQAARAISSMACGRRRRARQGSSPQPFKRGDRRSNWDSRLSTLAHEAESNSSLRCPIVGCRSTKPKARYAPLQNWCSCPCCPIGTQPLESTRVLLRQAWRQILESSDRTRVTTSSQSPWRCCRNSRAAAYHGLSLRLSIQRQSGVNGSNIQVGRPIAAERCATAVSTLITMSINDIKAAVSEKSVSVVPTWTMCSSSSTIAWSSDERP